MFQKPPVSQATLEYLNTVLSQRGQSAVPYAEQVKLTIRDHLSELQKVFPSLAIKLSDFHTNDGRLLHLLKADGTIPIHYQNSKYNIPVVFWLVERYPYDPPLAYVVPTQNMVIKLGHPFVDRNGQVATATMRNWIFPSSNLVDLALEMSQIFGSDPPLYTAPPGTVQQPVQQPGSNPSQPQQPPAGYQSRPPLPTVLPPAGYPAPSYGPGYSQPARPQNTPPPPPFTAPPGYSSQPPASSSGPASASNPYPDINNTAASNPLWGAIYQASFGRPPPPPSYPQPSSTGSSYGGPPPGRTPSPPPPQVRPPVPQIRADELHEEFRKVATEALRMQLMAAHKVYQEHVQQETDRLLETQRTLMDRKSRLQGTVNAFKQERMGTEGVVKEMGSKTQQLQQWLERNEPKVVNVDMDNIDWDKAVLPMDELSKQSLEAQAQDLAYEDAILALDKALQSDVSGMTVDSYLKQVRSLCRKQFFARAMGLKVAEMQRAQPAPAPIPGVLRPYPLAHGDSWSSTTITNTGLQHNPLTS